MIALDEWIVPTAGPIRASWMADMEPLASLVEMARAGDRDAFAEIVRRLSRQAVATAHLITGDLQTGEDVAQEAFLLCWRKLGRLKEAAAFRRWFGVILTRTACRARLTDECIEAIARPVQSGFSGP